MYGVVLLAHLAAVRSKKKQIRGYEKKNLSQLVFKVRQHISGGSCQSFDPDLLTWSNLLTFSILVLPNFLEAGTENAN